MLSEKEVQAYRDNGFIMAQSLIEPALMDAIRAEVDEVVAKSRDVAENDDVYDLEDTHSMLEPRVRRLKVPHTYCDAVARVARHPGMVSILRQLIGPGVRLQTSKLNMKSAQFGAPVEWHQDWAFYPHTNDDLLAAGILLDDCDEENGPMLVVPGSHRGPTYDHHADGYFCGAIDPNELDSGLEQEAVPLTGPAGSVSFHHVRTLHGSALNRSQRTRRLLLIQYTANDAWPLVQPVKDIFAYDQNIVAGEPTLYPRMVATPVRMPLPAAKHEGSIYENQRTLGRRYFDSFQGQP